MAANPKNIKQTQSLSLSAGMMLSVARVPGTEQLYVGDSVGKIYHVDLAADKPTPTSWQGHVTYVSSLVLADKHLISAGSDHRLIWWDRETRQQVRSLEAHAGKWVRCLALSPDGRTLASVGDDMSCRLWEAGTGKPLAELRGHELRTPQHFASKLFTCTFSADGKYLASADMVGDIIVWDHTAGKQLALIKAPLFYKYNGYDFGFGGIRSLAFAPDGQRLAAGGCVNGENLVVGEPTALVQVFAWQKGQMAIEFREKDSRCMCDRLAFHHQGDWLLAAGGTGRQGQQLVFYDLAKKQALHRLPAGMQVLDLVLNETSEVIYAVGTDEKNEGKSKTAIQLSRWELKG
jgi:WD40 repeat protein